jgi:hypothetical protein
MSDSDPGVIKEANVFNDIEARKISLFHDRHSGLKTGMKDQPLEHVDGIWVYIERNHLYNSMLWLEEDLARRRDVADSEIAANKRTIDGYNQKRQDAIERIDEELLKRLESVTPVVDAWQNSETAGSIIDRLSILSLKIYHMRLQTERNDAEVEHIQACQQKLDVLNKQRLDLQKCLNRLFAAAAQGSAYFRVYRQYKMYNDPKLNPYLYKDKKT